MILGLVDVSIASTLDVITVDIQLKVILTDLLACFKNKSQNDALNEMNQTLHTLKLEQNKIEKKERR